MVRCCDVQKAFADWIVWASSSASFENPPRNCSSRRRDRYSIWLGGERGPQIVEDGAAVRFGGADDGAERGVGLRAPFGTEAVRDFAENHARA